jgi:Spy/CpxP family protein refolding chaperone
MTHNWLRFLAVPAIAGGMFVAAGQEVPAQPQPPAAQSQRRANRSQRIANYLGLTAAQTEQAQAEMHAARAATQPVRQQLRQVRQQMFQAIQANDLARINQLSAQEGSLKGQLMAARFSAMAKIYSSLTPEQKAKADQLPARMQQMRQQWMQRHSAGNNG